jgi:hypothetical protein
MIPQAQIDAHLQMLEETLTHLHACRAALDEEVIKRQPASGEWSALEVLAHLRAAAEVFSHSIFMFLLDDWPTIPYIHPNKWRDMQGYSEITFDENLQIFELNRRYLLRKLRNLTPSTWERSGTIKTQTRTVYGEMRRMALHEKGHYGQIQALWRP